MDSRRRQAARFNPTKRAIWVTIIFCLLTVFAAPGYWILGALASWGGPENDITIGILLTPVVILYACLVSRCGPRLYCISASVYASVISALLIARYIEISGRSGYNQLHANASLASLCWTFGLFAIGLAFTVFRSHVMREPKLDKPNSPRV